MKKEMVFVYDRGIAELLQGTAAVIIKSCQSKLFMACHGFYWEYKIQDKSALSVLKYFRKKLILDLWEDS